MENRQVENRIKQLRNEALALEHTKRKQTEKTDKIRKPILINIGVAGALHFVGAFIHPFVVVGALTFLLVNNIVGAVLIFGGEDKEEKIQKQIDDCNEEANKLEEQLESQRNEAYLAKIPTPEISLKETPTISTYKTNTKTINQR